MALTLWLFSACGGGSSGTSSSGGTGGTTVGSGSSSGGSESGMLTINMTDSSFSEAKAVLVTFNQVQVHSSGGTWVTVPFKGGAGSCTCDLEKLTNGAQDVLGTGPLPAGHYTMVRLVVSQSTLYFDNPSAGPACGSTIAPPAGASAPLTIPSGEIKLNREFDLTRTRSTTMLLGFDGDRSINRTGNDNYMMNPVMGIVSVQ
jgi:hypothetical protein